MPVIQWFNHIKLAALVAAIFAHGPLVADQMESAKDLLARMAYASKNLSYQGVFTYEYRGQLRSVKVQHLVRDGETYERVTHMDGPAREIFRRADNVDCIRAGDMLLRGGALKLDRGGYSKLEDLYEFHIRDDVRIAGRRAYRVEILPRDKLRYGYVVAIDKISGLMLQSMLINQSGKPLERFQYVDITFSEALDSVPLPAELVNAPEVSQSDCLISNQQAEPLPSQWEPKWLPPGFVLSSYQMQDDEESWMYTDGLAVFSVFIDSAERSRNLPPVDAKLGTTVAVLTKAQFNNQHYAICVVGEIPRATAQQIANAISPVILTPQAQQQGH